jgi:hypothetical protein
MPRFPFTGNLLIVRSDSGDDLDPSLVHRLEPLSLLLRILVWDGADEVVPPAVLVDLAARCALINWTYLSRKVDLGKADDHGKSAGSDPPHRSISRYNFDQEISTIEDFPFL